MTMTMTELCSLLELISEIQVRHDGGRVLVHVPAISRSMQIEPQTVMRHKYVTGPNGRRALLLSLDVEGISVQAIVAPTDLVFAPDTRDSGFKFRIDVTNVPPLVSFSEMMRDLNAVERKLSTETNLDKVLGTLVMLRYFVAGAKRLGIDCRDADLKLQPLLERMGLAARDADQEPVTPDSGLRRRRKGRTKPL
jgi:hypothetical protein